MVFRPEKLDVEMLGPSPSEPPRLIGYRQVSRHIPSVYEGSRIWPQTKAPKLPLVCN
jgi:hypothetical protein